MEDPITTIQDLVELVEEAHVLGELPLRVIPDKLVRPILVAVALVVVEEEVVKVLV